MVDLAVQSENASGPIDFDALHDKLERNIPAQTAFIQKTYAITDKKMLMSIVEALTEGIRPLNSAALSPSVPELGNARENLNQQSAALGTETTAALPLGNDAMVTAPQGLELANDLAIARAEQQQGRSSYDEHDLGLLKARVENRVKELMAAGKSRDEIMAEIGMLGGANAELAQQIAQEQYEANKNPFEIPKNEQGVQQQQAESALTIASLLGFAAAKEEPQQGQKPAMTPQEELAVAIWAPKPVFAQAEEPVRDANPLALALAKADPNIAKEFADALKGESNAAMDPMRLAELNRDKERSQTGGIVV